MVNSEVHAEIWKTFRLNNRRRRKAIPYCSGWRYTRNDLTKVFRNVGYKKGAEIGVRFGYFSKIICENNPDLKLYCIDPWDAYDTKYPQEKQDEIYLKAVENLEPYNVQIVRMTSMNALDQFADGSLDFVYIDGNHDFDYVMMDIICWSKKVRSGGIVAGHDYYSGEVGIMKAVDAYTHSHNIRPWYVTKDQMPTFYWVKP